MTFDGEKWKRFDCNLLFSFLNVLILSFWSVLATNINEMRKGRKRMDQ